MVLPIGWDTRGPRGKKERVGEAPERLISASFFSGAGTPWAPAYQSYRQVTHTKKLIIAERVSMFRANDHTPPGYS